MSEQTFNLKDKVLYKGVAYVVYQIDGDKLSIYPARRDRYGYHRRTIVTASNVAPWVPKSKVSEHAKTCQICARPIHAALGIIAHHGYERPGQGYQTASCEGARELPFEVSREVLWRHIVGVTGQKDHTAANLSRIKADPTFEVPGPEVDVLKDGKRVYIDGRRQTTKPRIGPDHKDYAHYRGILIANIESELRQLENYIVYQQGRFDKWVKTE